MDIGYKETKHDVQFKRRKKIPSTLARYQTFVRNNPHSE